MKLEEYLSPLYRNISSVFAAAAAALRVGCRLFASPNTLPLPPGPSAHSFWHKTAPISFAPFKIEQWTKQYGPVFSLRRGEDVYIVIGRHQAAMEIMERESASLVDRPYFSSVGETIESGMRVHDMHAGPTLDKLRRAMHVFFQSDAVDTPRRALFRAAVPLVHGISFKPNEHWKLTRDYTTSLIHTLAYAHCTTTTHHVTQTDVRLASNFLEHLPTIRPPHDWVPGRGKPRYVDLSGDGDRTNEGWSVGTDKGKGTGKGKGKKVNLKSWLGTMADAKVDLNASVKCTNSNEGVGVLHPEPGDDHRYTCGYGYGNLSQTPSELEELHKWYVEEGQFHKGLVDSVREDLNTTAPCFTTYLLSQQASATTTDPDGRLSDDELACVVGSMFGAGADTMASATRIIIMAAATHPLAQTRVQEELDRFAGGGHSPMFEEEALPMTMAFMLESFRWRPVTMNGYPHRATKDIIWKNYIIPKGAVVIGNHWAIAHDPEVYPKPDEFDPLRWLNKAGQLRDDLKFFNYGFGQRVCPGQDLANRSLFIATALLLWSFRISEDPENEIDTMKFTNSVNKHPKPFAAMFDKRGSSIDAVGYLMG